MPVPSPGRPREGASRAESVRVVGLRPEIRTRCSA
jgi:hypothetical protein